MSHGQPGERTGPSQCLSLVVGAATRGSLKMMTLPRSLVCNVEDLLLTNKTTICNLQLRLVERLGLVERVSVCGAVLVGVKVLLSLPARAIPQLTVTLVPAVHCVGPAVDLQLGGILEGRSWLSAPPVGAVVLLGAEVAGAGGRGSIVIGLVVPGSVEHCASSVTAASHLHTLVLLRDQLCVKSVRMQQNRNR